MCVILNVPARVEFPFDKLKSACRSNSDGWGILVKDRGKIEMHKLYNGKPNDPEVIMKAMEDAKEHERYVHLRFTTHGAVNTANCHPFLITEPNAEDQYFLMHNGVFGNFGGAWNKSDGHSDTWNFNEIFLKPLFERVLAFSSHPLDDPFLKYMLKRECGTSNRVLIASSVEDEPALMVGGEWFQDDEGWWASNNYYFDKPRNYGSYNTPYTGYQSAAPFRGSPGRTTSGGNAGTNYLPRTEHGTSGGVTQCNLPPVSEKLTDLKDALDEKHFSTLEKDVFDIWGCETLEDFHELSLADLEMMTTADPKAAALLIVHLLAEVEHYRNFDADIDAEEDTIETEYEEVLYDNRALA